MTERPGPAVRPNPMLRSLALGALLVVALTGCGDDVKGASKDSSATANACDPTQASRPSDLQVDLDGDGKPDVVGKTAAKAGCPAYLVPSIGAEVPVDGDLPVTDLAAITIPGRTGEVVLATQSSPRGGARTRLFGYADGTFAELTADGKPVLSFVATDAPTEHVSAACTPDGFAVTEAVAHQPIGVVPAWDVYRTAYTVDGNKVTAGPRKEIEDNVLDAELSTKYPEVVDGTMFQNCRARVN